MIDIIVVFGFALNHAPNGNYCVDVVSLGKPIGGCGQFITTRHVAPNNVFSNGSIVEQSLVSSVVQSLSHFFVPFGHHNGESVLTTIGQVFGRENTEVFVG